ncbi:MAG: M48 family metallopeptidase [Pseudobdellovibrionaceae bacterium]|nr:M48 family metallopeptidase [Bdellovibrionales bacterium]USN48629.1 MAG: M48 family metallopeptidase [Pseudobdellovibrionaceae bacterium]
MVVSGWLYDGQTSNRVSAQISVRAGQVHVEVDGALRVFPLKQVNVSEPLAQVARTVDLPDGSRFESRELSAMETLFPPQNLWSLIHKIESQLGWAILATIVVLILSWMLYKEGLPWAAKFAAHMVPQEWAEFVEEGTNKSIKQFFGLTSEEVSLAEWPWAPALFKKVEEKYKDKKVNIRPIQSERIGPNAFALPAGTIYITTDLLNVCKNNPDEVYAVLLHEVGHVQHRHGLQMVIQQTGLMVFLSLIVGASDFSNIPLVLMSASYSRDHEKEADVFAAKKLAEEGLSVDLLISALNKMEEFHAKGKNENQETHRMLGILSSHPITADRAVYLREVEQKTKKERK